MLAEINVSRQDTKNAARFSVMQETLDKALKALSGSVDNKPSMPILENVHIRTELARVQITATNMDIYTSMFIGAKVDTQGEFCLPYRTLKELTALLSPERCDFMFYPDGSNPLHHEFFSGREIKPMSVVQTCGTNRTTWHAYPASEYPAVPTFSPEHEIGEVRDTKALIAAFTALSKQIKRDENIALIARNGVLSVGLYSANVLPVASVRPGVEFQIYANFGTLHNAVKQTAKMTTDESALLYYDGSDFFGFEMSRASVAFHTHVVKHSNAEIITEQTEIQWSSMTIEGGKAKKINLVTKNAKSRLILDFSQKKLWTDDGENMTEVSLYSDQRVGPGTQTRPIFEGAVLKMVIDTLKACKSGARLFGTREGYVGIENEKTGVTVYFQPNGKPLGAAAWERNYLNTHKTDVTLEFGDSAMRIDDLWYEPITQNDKIVLVEFILDDNGNRIYRSATYAQLAKEVAHGLLTHHHTHAYWSQSPIAVTRLIKHLQTL